MKNSLCKFVIVLTCLLMMPTLMAGPNEPQPQPANVKAAVIICTGLIDEGLYKSIRRRTEIALDAGAQYLLYEIQTYGGLVQSADDISKYLILDIGKKARTVAYITSEAISAGAMISVSCQDIIMLENTTIGDCAPMQLGGKLEGVEREKAESFIRATFARAAEANGYPRALLEAMVSMKAEVYRVRNLKSNEYEFFEVEQLPKDANGYDLDNKKLIVSDEKILTLTASEAFEYGVARVVVEDLAGALRFLSERDGVAFAEKPLVLETNWSEDMVRWVNHPAVMSILIMVALLGVYVELNTPGVGLPGLVAVICFAIIIGSKYLVGLANWVEVALFIVGIILLMVEIFVLPGFGFAGILGILCILAGIFGMLIKNAPDEVPWPQTAFDWQLFMNGVWGLSFGFLGFMVLALALTKYLPKLQFLSGLTLVPTVAHKGGEMQVSMTRPPESKAVNVNIGDIGKVLSTLRPAGTAQFGDAIVDVVAEGEFLYKGRKIEITEIHGNRVVVKAVEEEES